MTLQTPKSRIYIGLFLFIVLIVIPYLLGGLSGIVGMLIFAGLYAAVIGFVNQFQNISPALRLYLTALIVIIMVVALFVAFLAFAARSGPWLPVAD